MNNPPALLKFQIYPAASRLRTLQRTVRRGKTALPMTEEAARTELFRTIIEKGGVAFRQSDSRIAELRRCQCGYRFPSSGDPFSLHWKENLCQWDITMIFLSGL
ncbi:hypothetical protein DWY99_05880 [[Clostridium] leptum]|uniref:Uncharacterized protein n=1 Tax=[Clostridium] leptum TaxID=1535 RepID=A0A412AY44_9FIRM|nr:hypothetical protein DWY99_05880 [[Clostridium] leptum]